MGNVEARLWQAAQPDRQERPIAYRGIVGSAIPSVRGFDFSLPAGWRLLLHTDGVSARLDVPAIARYATLQEQADAALAGWARNTDDATVVLAADSAAGTATTATTATSAATEIAVNASARDS